MQIITIIAPVFLLIALGWGLLRWRFFTASALSDVNRLCYWVALPTLLFESVATSEPDFRAAGGLFGVVLAATVLGIVVAAAYAVISRMPPTSRGAFIQGAFRGNMVFVGLPVVLYAFAAMPQSTTNAEQAALLIIGPMIGLYNVFGVLVLLVSAGGLNGPVLRAALVGLVTNPLLIACAAGLLFALTDTALPDMAARTLEATGRMAFPLALICIGGALYLTRIRGNLGPAIVGSMMKVTLLPVIGYGLARWAGLSDDHALIAVIMLASPTAAASYVLTLQLKGDDALASSIILISHVVVVPALLVILAVMIQGG